MIDEDGLFRLGSLLRERGYRFATITPLSHARVLEREYDERRDASGHRARTLRDVFGWNKAFDPDSLPTEVLSLLKAANAVEQVEKGEDRGAAKLRSTVRFSTLAHEIDGCRRDDIYAHSAYPTKSADAVFFGPDTYRFVALIERELAAHADPVPRRVADIGCGAGPGGISAAQQIATSELVLADINPVALKYARVNTRLAGLDRVFTRQSNLFNELIGSFDLIIANPPYLMDSSARVYRHGGGNLGSALSTRIVVEGLPRLTAGGMLIVYTGAPVVAGEDVFLASVEPLLRNADVQYAYRELDPDVFGEELDNPGYENVERIAAVGLVIRNLPGSRSRILQREQAAS